MFDLVIRNARVVDGSGSPWFESDIGIEGNLITKIGRLSKRCETGSVPGCGMIP